MKTSPHRELDDLTDQLIAAGWLRQPVETPGPDIGVAVESLILRGLGMVDTPPAVICAFALSA